MGPSGPTLAGRIACYRAIVLTTSPSPEVIYSPLLARTIPAPGSQVKAYFRIIECSKKQLTLELSDPKL